MKDISKGSRTSEKEIDNFLNSFLYCLQPANRNKIQIFSLDSDRDLDDTIFEAIIQGIFFYNKRIALWKFIFYSKKTEKFRE